MSNEAADPAYWDDMAARYEAMAAPFTGHFAKEALAGLDLGRGTRMLDVATGTGALAVLAADAGADVTAIDFAPQMVARAAAHGHPRITALQMDGQAMALPDAAFDIVASVFGVMLFPDWRAGLAEMARVCTPGGTAIVAVWSDPEGAAIFQLLAQVRQMLFPDMQRPPPPPGMIALSSTTGLVEALTAAGFTDARARTETHDFQLEMRLLDDPDTAFGMMPLWADLNTAQRIQVHAEIMRRAAAAGASSVLPIASTALITVAKLPG